MFTFVVITCNRVHYLKNCVNSILEFVDLDNIDLLIIDNATTEPGIEEYFSSLPTNVEIKRFKDRSFHELHRAMNFAIKYSIQKGNKFVNFIQDDYQYLYKKNGFVQILSDAFSYNKNIIQLQTNLIWKRKKHKLGKIIPFSVNGINWFLFNDKPPCDNGITRVDLYKKIGFYPETTSIHGDEKGFVSGESWFAKKCKKEKRALLAEPNMGMLFDCAYIRGKSRIGKYFPPPEKYYLKPFDDVRIKKIENYSRKGKLIFIEDWLEPMGWNANTKIKHSKSNSRSYISAQ